MKLEEAFFDYKPAPFFLKDKVGKDYEIFVNPTHSEMKEFGKEGFRFLADAKEKKLYIFNVYILHQMVVNDIWPDKDLYTMPWMLPGITQGFPPKLEQLSSLTDGAKKVYSKKYYEGIKKYEWDWLNRYFDISELDKEIKGL